MRIWSVHPKYLDAQGLVALWRETLLAKNVLLGNTKGYTHHPQLQRFRATEDPVRAVNTYLSYVYTESVQRGYNFDASKIGECSPGIIIPLHDKQLQYETEHLKRKLQKRSPEMAKKWGSEWMFLQHPLFQIIPGEIESWEIV